MLYKKVFVIKEVLQWLLGMIQIKMDVGSEPTQQCPVRASYWTVWWL